MTAFDAFWAAWPPNTSSYTRKGCRAECLRRWVIRGLDAEAEHIIRHVRWLRTTEDWMKNGGAFIPAPLVYINQSRWDGAEIPESAVEASSAYLATLREYKASKPTAEIQQRLALVKRGAA